LFPYQYILYVIDFLLSIIKQHQLLNLIEEFACSACPEFTEGRLFESEGGEDLVKNFLPFKYFFFVPGLSFQF